MDTEKPDTLAVLFSYLDRGWNIFPVEPNGKRPVVVSQGRDQDGSVFDLRLKWNTFQYNRVDQDQVKTWFEQYNDCNWAVVCGKISNLVVLDVDGEIGIKSLEKHHSEIQGVKTFMQASPHGIHMFFTHPGNDVKSFPILTKVDVKGDGGYIVVAPSKIDEESYQVLIDTELRECPGWIARGESIKEDSPTASSPDSTGDRRPQWVKQLLDNGSPEGRRSDDASRLVGYFWNRNVSPDIIETVITPWANRCKPAFDMRELKTVIRSICSYQQTAKHLGIVAPPVMTSTGTGTKYSWHTLKIDIVVSKLMETERYGLVGELDVRTNGIPSVRHFLYGPVDVSFKSSRDLASLVTEMEKLMSGPPWRQMINDIARLSIGQFTKGTPWILLREAPRAQQQGFAHKPLLLAKEPTLWFSAGGGLKSYLALTLAVMMETGVDFGIGPALVRNHVAYLDWEWDVGQHARRLDTIISPADQERLGANIIYRNCGGRPLRKQIDEIKRMVAEEGITYIIIDSASPACGRASDNDEIVAFFQAIAQIGVGSLILAHITKADRSSQDDVATAFGGVQWENQARSTWHLRKIQEEGSTTADLVLTHHKINAGNMNRPFALRFFFPDESDPDGVVQIQGISPENLPAETLKEGGVSFRDRVKYALKNRPMPAEELAEVLGVYKIPARVATLRSMEQSVLNRVVKKVDGEPLEFWSLKSPRMAE